MKAIPILVAIAVPIGASAAERWAVPDPMVTPGAVNPAATIEALCAQTDLAPKEPSLPSWVIEFELSSYNIPSSNSTKYQLNYLIPLSLGGANTISNVWLQPRTEVERKAELEMKLQRQVCAAFKNGRPQEAAEVLANAQRYLAEDWTAAYADYVDKQP